MGWLPIEKKELVARLAGKERGGERRKGSRRPGLYDHARPSASAAPIDVVEIAAHIVRSVIFELRTKANVCT